MDFKKKGNDLKINKKLSYTARKIVKNRKDISKLNKDRLEYQEIRELLGISEKEYHFLNEKDITLTKKADPCASCNIPLNPPGSEVIQEDKIFSYFNEKTLCLKDFLNKNGGCSHGKDYEVPNEDLFRTFIVCHAAETFSQFHKKCRFMKLYVLYLLSVHPDQGFVCACVEFLKCQYFKISAFEILPIYVNFGCTLDDLLGSNDGLDLPVGGRLEKRKGENHFPYYNVEMVSDLILHFANYNLIKRNEELKVLLKALTRLTLDRKIRCSRLLPLHSLLIGVLSRQLTDDCDVYDIVSCLHLKNEHLLNQLEVARIIHMPVSSKLQELLLIKTINCMQTADASADRHAFKAKYVLSVLKNLTGKSLPPLQVYCILQLINGSLPKVTATKLEASDINYELLCLEAGFSEVTDPLDLVRLRLEAAKLRNLVMNSAEVFPGTNTERKMVDFLKDLSFLILPLGMGSKRLDFFAEQIRKYSGKLRDKSVATHVIIDESVGENKEKCLMALETHGIVLSARVKFVGTKWLSKCFAMKTLVNTKPFEFDWAEKEIERLSSKLDQDGSRNSDYKEFDENHEESPRKKTKLEAEKCICSMSSSPNRDISKEKKLIIDELQKLADAFAARNDTWRAYSYRNAVSAVARYDKDITTFQEACTIPGIGERMALKIMEILDSGKCGKVEDIVDEKTKVLERFCNIWGVGPSTAENWYHSGFRTLEDLKGKAKLNKQQEIGLNFYEDFMQRMTREDVERIGSIVEDELKKMNCLCRMELVGSFRRGKETCGDVDVMVVNPGPKYPLEILLELTDNLRRKGYLTHDLVELDDSLSSDENNSRKYMGVFKFPGEKEIHRRIDIFVVPENEYAPGLMHYTGSAMFNRSMRLLASRKGLTLNEHGLYSGIIRKGSDILNEGKLVPTPTEYDIFDYLGLEYKLPEERDH